MKNTGPVYLLKPGDPVIASWKNNIETLKKPETKTMVIAIPPDAVKAEDVQMFQEMVLVLQHYPEAIEKLLFNVEFEFTEIEGSELYFPEEVSINDEAVQRWFYKMGSLLNTVFFMNSSESRMLCLAGDLIADNKVNPIIKGKNNTAYMRFEGEHLQLVVDRLFASCWFMLLYCHKTGFDPTEYIETLIAEFDMLISFEDVKKKYEEDIEKGIQLRAQPSQND